MDKMIFILACIFSMCVKPPEHVAVSDKSVEHFAEGIKSDKLEVLAIGGFYDNKKVENLYLDLEYKGVMSAKRARGHLIKYVRGMLSHINSDEDLSPFLIKEKFTSNDISLSLAYTSEEGVSCQVHNYEGKIIFSTYDKKTNQLNKTHTEDLAL